jgi:hypothetical protein
MRKINITREDFNCCDDFLIEDEYINATYELWFEWDMYFGTDLGEDEWINFYTDWYPDGTIKACYSIEGEKSSKFVDWELTEEEKKMFLECMEEYCKEMNGMSLKELWDSYAEESEE